MPFFSQKDCQELMEGHLAVPNKYTNILKYFLEYKCNNFRAREYIDNGFLRRIKILVRCIENVFSIFPPSRDELLGDNELSDVSINLQSFILNIFGCVDNLAWIWVYEKNITKSDGTPIPRQWVGFRKNNSAIRESFSHKFKKYLEKLDDWFDYIENYRHALSHRIILYVPPYIVPQSKEEDYLNIESLKTESLRQNDLKYYYHLSSKQDGLGIISPFMVHSFEEGAKQIYFHPQMLADFNTIEELAWKFLEELSS